MLISDWSSDVCASDLVNKTVVVIYRLLNELTDDIARTQNYFANERLNLTAMQVAIDNGEYIGGSLANRAYGVPAPAPAGGAAAAVGQRQRSEEHTSELQSLMRISYAVFCLQKKKTQTTQRHAIHI